MRVADTYLFCDSEKENIKEYQFLISEIYEVIEKVNAENCRLKVPRANEINRAKRAGITKFYSPIHLNLQFDYYLWLFGWQSKQRISTRDVDRNGFREIDFLKDKLGLEVQFGKYAFLTYDIIAKMVIFRNFGLMNFGVEICPMASMLPQMSSGIGCFEQVRWDLEYRQSCDLIDVPTLIIGIEPVSFPRQKSRHIFGKDVPEIEVKMPIVKSYTETQIKQLKESGIDF